MIKAERSTLDPRATYVHLLGDGTGTPIAVGPDFWKTTIQTIRSGWLLTVGRSERDWPHWEMHPRGEELIFLLSGAVELVVEDDDGEHVVPLAAGQAYLMRRGVWHRAIVKAPGDMLFLTAGEGTQHRPHRP
jgi:mannose-6-phosphate isomerase-like protein (cupin superfamily)